MDNLHEIFAAQPNKITISKPASKNEEFKKAVVTKTKNGCQIEKFTSKQAFHENVTVAEAETFCRSVLGNSFLQLNAWDGKYEHILLISRKGRESYKKKRQDVSFGVRETHNREKNYILPEGTVIPPLVDMGIFTAEGRVVHSMYDKFKQINRFIEIIDDEIRGKNFETLNIIDFGCGKSYLTFIMYYYFTEIRKISVNMVGLDLKAEVIAECSKTAEKYGYDKLHFELGDISGYKTDRHIDMVITLHACDTATDYALYNAIKWNADMIFSVPCCQHELNAQMNSDKLSLLTKYGIIRERTAALITDAIRANMLEASGYKVQLLEFVDLSHTPKNILLRAVKHNTTQAVRKNALAEAERVMEEFNLDQTLYRLLKNGG